MAHTPMRVHNLGSGGLDSLWLESVKDEAHHIGVSWTIETIKINVRHVGPRYGPFRQRVTANWSTMLRMMMLGPTIECYKHYKSFRILVWNCDEVASNIVAMDLEHFLAREGFEVVVIISHSGIVRLLRHWFEAVGLSEHIGVRASVFSDSVDVVWNPNIVEVVVQATTPVKTEWMIRRLGYDQWISSL